MVQEDIHAEHLKAHIVDVVLRLARLVLVRENRLDGAEGFDHHFLNVAPKAVHIAALLAEELEDAGHASLVADVHLLRALVEAGNIEMAYMKFSLSLLTA